ncbi:MAG: hypothetical protein WBB82_03005 [Limnothrix sp.]
MRSRTLWDNSDSGLTAIAFLHSFSAKFSLLAHHQLYIFRHNHQTYSVSAQCLDLPRRSPSIYVAK